MNLEGTIQLKTVYDIPEEYQHTPIGKLIEYHNFQRPFDKYKRAELLVGMCMDNRKSLRMPENFAYVLRTGGANMRNNEFKVSYAIAVGGVQSIALIGHNHCSMVNLDDRREQYIDGLVENAGWEREKAQEYFIANAPIFDIGNERDFILSETRRLRLRFPKVQVAPFLYRVEDHLLYLIT